ncbi:MAG TPA: cytochrome c maturation protein CcmE [Gemmatimonadaceae bacterium]|nr:cytochrome c maturation protein CcmE [Gemmatimonadaceae bacterium]
MTAPNSPPPSGAAPGVPPRRRSPFTVAALVALIAAFAWLIWGGLNKNVVYFLEPHELIAKGPGGMGVPVRLGGLVRAGSVKWDAATRDLQFDVTDTTGMFIHVKSTGVPPQMFRDNIGVVVEGKLGNDRVFDCTGLMVKHSNEYRAPKAGEQPKNMYKSLMKGAGA